MSYVCFPCSSIEGRLITVQLCLLRVDMLSTLHLTVLFVVVKFSSLDMHMRLLHLDLFFTFCAFCYEAAVIRGRFHQVLTGRFRLLHMDILFSLYLTAVFVLSSLYLD